MLQTLLIFSEQNQLILIRQRFTGDLLTILSRLELLVDPGRNLIKIAGALLSVCLHLVPSSKKLYRLLRSKNMFRKGIMLVQTVLS